MSTAEDRRGRFIVVPGIAILALLIPRCATIVTNIVWPLVSAADPERVFLWTSIHHVLALAFTVLVMMYRTRFPGHTFVLCRLA